jgi:hypothetical protein
MPQDEHARRTHEPEERAEWGRDPEQRYADDEQARVETLLRDLCSSNMDRLRTC